MSYRNMILWGLKLDHAATWLKLQESPSLRDVEDRRQTGWQVRVLPKGQHPDENDA